LTLSPALLGCGICLGRDGAEENAERAATLDGDFEDLLRGWEGEDGVADLR
jgi:hypothetical protein